MLERKLGKIHWCSCIWVGGRTFLGNSVRWRKVINGFSVAHLNRGIYPNTRLRCVFARFFDFVGWISAILVRLPRYSRSKWWWLFLLQQQQLMTMMMIGVAGITWRPSAWTMLARKVVHSRLVDELSDLFMFLWLTTVSSRFGVGRKAFATNLWTPSLCCLPVLSSTIVTTTYPLYFLALSASKDDVFLFLMCP